MSESIFTGYLISIKNFDENDHILNFIFNDNKIIGMLSKGSQKTLSKNGRFLLYRSLLEVEYFQARFDDKLSRLKKIKPLEMVKLQDSYHPAINLLNNYLIKNRLKIFDFQIYKNLIKNTYEYDNLTCLLICLNEIVQVEGLLLKLDSCVKCHLPNVYSFSSSNKGFLCKNCYRDDEKNKTSRVVNQTLYFLAKKNYSKIYFNQDETKIKVLKILINFLYEMTGLFFDFDTI